MKQEARANRELCSTWCDSLCIVVVLQPTREVAPRHILRQAAALEQLRAGR